MIYEKFIKDERGRVRIEVKFVTFSYGTDLNGNYFRYDIGVYYTKPKKRTEIWDNGIATPEEIHQSKMELWSLIKPTL